MKFLKRLFAGMAIGVGAAIPGVSGAAIALIFHVYEEIIDAVNTFRKRFGYALKVLLPIILGVVIALIPCIYLFSLAFEHMMFVLLCLFAGFLAGSLPGITDEVKGYKPTKKQWIIIVISILFVIALGVLSVFLGPNIDMNSQFDKMPIWLYFVLVPVGIVAAVALTVPGMSGSLILLVIGFYRPLIDHVRLWGGNCLKGDWSGFGQLIGTIGTFGIGCVIGVVLVSKVMTYLLNKDRVSTYYGIIGFIIGSFFVLFFNYEIYNYYLNWAGVKVVNAKINPILPMYLEMIIGFACLALTTFLSYQMVRYQRKMTLEAKKEEN
ncbi:MAG: DUF368 domain-containing protein [Bacilli bacterium]|nr:DUF368 domain-containing protein [Bacilli bacterium]